MPTMDEDDDDNENLFMNPDDDSNTDDSEYDSNDDDSNDDDSNDDDSEYDSTYETDNESINNDQYDPKGIYIDEDELIGDCGPCVFKYTCQQAIEDGTCKPIQPTVALYGVFPKHESRYQPLMETIIRTVLSNTDYDYFNILTYHSFVNPHSNKVHLGRDGLCISPKSTTHTLIVQSYQTRRVPWLALSSRWFDPHGGSGFYTQ